jgi:DNA-binding CsgD family transcriptional regulator/tetratricopeptide (TPR) repeat protein
MVQDASPGGREELHERADELGALQGLLEAACHGQSGIGIVRAGAGLGKTSLLRALAAHARARGALLLEARGSPQERDFPFGVVHQLLDRLVLAAGERERTALFAGPARFAQPLFHPSADPATFASIDPAFATLHGLFWIVAGLAHSGPVLLAVDDADWCDRPSGRFMSFLARRLEGLPLVMLVAARAQEPSAGGGWLSELIDDPRSKGIAPRPLSPGAVSAIAAARFADGLDHAFGVACWEVTGGNPFFVHTVLDELARNRTSAEARLESLRGLGPEAVLRSVLVRLATLAPGAVALSHSVAVLGDGATLLDAAAAAQLPVEVASAAADRLHAIGVFAAGERLAFAHPIVRNALYGDLTRTARARLHARAARILTAGGASAPRIAVHLLHTPPTGTPGVVQTLRGAADVALAEGAPEVASSYLRRALEEPCEANHQAELLIALGSAESQAGHPDAVEHLTAGFEHATNPDGRVAAGLALANALASGPRSGEAIQILARLGEELRCVPALAERVFTELISLADQDLTLRRLIPTHLSRKTLGEQPTALAHRAVDATLTASSATQTARLAERALAGDELLATGGALFSLTCALLIFAEAFDVARRGVDRALSVAVSGGSAPAFVAASAQRALLHIRRGALLDAEADARGALDAADLHGWPDWQDWRLHTLRMAIDALLARGDADAAAAEIDRRIGWALLPPSTQGAAFLEARGRLRIEIGERDAGVADLLDAGRRFESWGLLNPAVYAWRSHAALALADRGDEEHAKRLVDQELALARRWGAPRAITIALRAQALIYDDQDTIPRLTEAAAILHPSHSPVEHARALCDLGAALRRSNHRARAREPLRQALAQAHSCGASALAERAHSELQAAGARPRTPLRAGPDALTPSERRIATMAAGGQPNRAIAQALFVTIKTVEMHLTSSYRKLNVSSRDALAQALTPVGTVEARSARIATAGTHAPTPTSCSTNT